MKHTHKPTDTHTYTRGCCCETNTPSHSRTCLGKATSSRQIMDVKKKVKRREEERNSRRGDHRLGARPRERTEKPGEFFGIKQCFLYQPRQGPAWDRGQAGSLRPEAPRLRPPLTFLSSPLSLFFPTHLTRSTSPSSSRKRVTLGHYLNFFDSAFPLRAMCLTVTPLTIGARRSYVAVCIYAVSASWLWFTALAVSHSDRKLLWI